MLYKFKMFRITVNYDSEAEKRQSRVIVGHDGDLVNYVFRETIRVFATAKILD